MNYAAISCAPSDKMGCDTLDGRISSSSYSVTQDERIRAGNHVLFLHPDAGQKKCLKLP